MVREVKGTFKVPSLELYTNTWLPDEETAIKAKLVFVHGFNDHIHRYYGFFPYLASRGIAVYGFDQRGWGRSVHAPAQKGLTGPTSEVIAEIAAVAKARLDEEPSNVPLFVLGHSMGGAEVLTLASDPAYEALVQRVRGWLLEAPFIGWAPDEVPSSLKVSVGRFVGRLLPHFHLKHNIPPEHLCRDPEVVQSLKDDELLHSTGTLEGLAGVLDRTDNLNAGRVHLLPPPAVRSIWLGHGTDDKTTSFAASRAWFDGETQVEDKTFKAYDRGYHQLHAEPGQMKEEFYADVARWILARSGGDDSAQATPPTMSRAEDTQGGGETSAEVADAAETIKPEAKL